MARITAEGTLFGSKCTAEAFLEDGAPIIEVDGVFDEWMQARFNRCMKKAPALGGTYYPLENTMLAAFLDEKNIPDSELEKVSDKLLEEEQKEIAVYRKNCDNNDTSSNG